MILLASRQEDKFRDLQSAMVAKLTEAIPYQISILPKWPQDMEKTQRRLRTDSIAVSTSRYKQPKKPALRTDPAPVDGQPEADHNPIAHDYAANHAFKLGKTE